MFAAAGLPARASPRQNILVRLRFWKRRSNIRHGVKRVYYQRIQRWRALGDPRNDASPILRASRADGKAVPKTSGEGFCGSDRGLHFSWGRFGQLTAGGARKIESSRVPAMLDRSCRHYASSRWLLRYVRDREFGPEKHSLDLL